jgi:predicted DNA-binding transcriptional regulator AlpA
MNISESFITLKEACQISGASRWTLYRQIQAGAFSASLPFGDKGGWRIVRQSFERWLLDRIGKTSNRRAA